MTEMITIGVRLTPQQYRMLASLAEAKNTQAHCLVEHLVVHALTPQPRRRRRSTSAVDHDELRRLHAQGLNDREVGERMGFTASTIQNHRDALNLPKNGKQGRPKKTQEAAA